MRTRRDGRGTEAGKERGRLRTWERDRVWIEGGMESMRERAHERVKETCTACILWRARER